MVTRSFVDGCYFNGFQWQLVLQVNTFVMLCHALNDGAWPDACQHQHAYALQVAAGAAGDVAFVLCVCPGFNDGNTSMHMFVGVSAGEVARLPALVNFAGPDLSALACICLLACLLWPSYAHAWLI
jgi:hypothetical protein